MVAPDFPDCRIKPFDGEGWGVPPARPRSFFTAGFEGLPRGRPAAYLRAAPSGILHASPYRMTFARI